MPASSPLAHNPRLVLSRRREQRELFGARTTGFDSFNASWLTRAFLQPEDGFEIACRDPEDKEKGRPKVLAQGYNRSHIRTAIHAACLFNVEEKVTFLDGVGAWALQRQGPPPGAPRPPPGRRRGPQAPATVAGGADSARTHLYLVGDSSRRGWLLLKNAYFSATSAMRPESASVTVLCADAQARALCRGLTHGDWEVNCVDLREILADDGGGGGGGWEWRGGVGESGPGDGDGDWASSGSGSGSGSGETGGGASAAAAAAAAPGVESWDDFITQVCRFRVISFTGP